MRGEGAKHENSALRNALSVDSLEGTLTRQIRSEGTDGGHSRKNYSTGTV